MRLETFTRKSLGMKAHPVVEVDEQPEGYSVQATVVLGKVSFEATDGCTEPAAQLVTVFRSGS